MKPPNPKYKWPTLSDRLNSKPALRAEALRQLREAPPLSESAQRELDTMVERSLVKITRVYSGGACVSMSNECAALQSELRAHLSDLCRVTGRWVTRRKAVLQIYYCGPLLSEAELQHMAHGVLRVLEPD